MNKDQKQLFFSFENDNFILNELKKPKQGEVVAVKIREDYIFLGKLTQFGKNYSFVNTNKNSSFGTINKLLIATDRL